MDEVIVWRVAFGALLGILAYFVKGMIERLEKGNEQIAAIHVDVAKILVKLDNQDEKIEKLESENKRIRDKLHIACNEITILKTQILNRGYKMAISRNYPFTTASNYATSGTIISGGEGKLDFENNAGQTFTEAFTSDTGFTYDSDKSEFTGGLVRHKAQNPTLSALGITYTSSVNANWSVAGDPLTATLNGSPTLTGGKLLCSGAQGARYLLTSKNDGNAAIKWIYTPTYNSSPSGANVHMVGINPEDGTSNGVFEVHHKVNGNIGITVFDSAGGSVYSNVNIGSTWLPTAGTDYELEINWDYSSGDIRLFIDGSLHGLLNSAGAWTHTGAATTYLVVGANARTLDVADASFDDVIFFDAPRHVGTGYIPGYTVPEYLYTTDTMTLPSFSYSGVGAIQSFDGFTTTETGSPRYIVNDSYWNGSSWVASNGTYSQASSASDINTNIASLTASDSVTVKAVTNEDTNTQDTIDNLTLTYTGEVYQSTGYIEPLESIQVQSLESYSHTITTPANTSLGVIIKVNSTLKYWDGAAWVTSDGTFAQSNTDSEVNTNISSLTFNTNSTVVVRWVLDTSDTSVTPSIDTSTISYDFGAVATNNNTCTIYGYYRDISGQGISGAKISFELDKSALEYSEANNSIIHNGKVSTLTDSNGYFEQVLIRASDYESRSQYKMTIVYNDKKVAKISSQNLLFSVPDETTKDITGLLTAQ